MNKLPIDVLEHIYKFIIFRKHPVQIVFEEAILGKGGDWGGHHLWFNTKTTKAGTKLYKLVITAGIPHVDLHNGARFNRDYTYWEKPWDATWSPWHPLEHTKLVIDVHREKKILDKTLDDYFNNNKDEKIWEQFKILHASFYSSIR